MKLQAIVSAVLFAAASSLSFGALAEDMEHMDKEHMNHMDKEHMNHMDKEHMGHMDKAPAKKGTMMKPHSHVEEKVTGTAAPKAVDAAAADSASATVEAKDEHAKKGKNMNHSHPRDAK
jgi:hypothetical protein